MRFFGHMIRKKSVVQLGTTTDRPKATSMTPMAMSTSRLHTGTLAYLHTKKRGAVVLGYGGCGRGDWAGTASLRTNTNLIGYDGGLG